MSWLDFLQPASWRGVPFAVLESEAPAGRRQALHEYPNRDVPWAEDMGLATKYFSFRGFLVGDDCYIQEQTMVAACDQPGPGTLIHPSYGFLSVSLMSFVPRQSADKGRYVSIDFTFVKGVPAQLFPSFITSTIDAVEGAANNALKSIGIDFATDIAAPLQAGAAAIQQGAAVATGALSAVQGFAATANRLVGDAGLITGATKGLSGNFGRFSLGSLSGPVSPTNTITSVLSGITTARTRVQDAGTEATNLAGLL